MLPSACTSNISSIRLGNEGTLQGQKPLAAISICNEREARKGSSLKEQWSDALMKYHIKSSKALVKMFSN